MDILLTFTGFHDPYSKGLVGEEERTRKKKLDKVWFYEFRNDGYDLLGHQFDLACDIVFPADS